jgi:hypothetical protein
MRQSQSPTPPAPPLNTPPTETSSLISQLTELKVQEAGLKAQLDGLRHQLRVMRRSDPGRPQVQAQQAELAVQLAQAQGDAARLEAQLAQQGIPISRPPFTPGRTVDPDLAIILPFILGLALIVPISFAIARRILRSAPKRTDDVVTSDIAPRLNRMEQAIDAIAIEMERVSESQRFMTKIMAERTGVGSVATPDQSQRGDRVAAMRELGAGAAEPIAMPDREAVRQRNTSQ